MPAPGKDKAFDGLMEKIEDIKSGFQAILDGMRKKFRCESIIYIHIKHRYELEFPEHLVEGTKKAQRVLFQHQRRKVMFDSIPQIYRTSSKNLKRPNMSYKKSYSPSLPNALSISTSTTQPGNKWCYAWEKSTVLLL